MLLINYFVILYYFVSEIRHEIRDIEEGKVDKMNNLLKNSPHPLQVVAGKKWEFPYSRTQAAFPLVSYLNLRKKKQFCLLFFILFFKKDFIAKKEIKFEIINILFFFNLCFQKTLNLV